MTRLLETFRAVGLGPALLLLGLAVGCGEQAGESSLPLHEQPGNKLFDPMPVGEFAFLDHHGQPFTRADLEGKLWIVDFIFTRCGSICPALTQEMRSIRDQLSEDQEVQFLSFTVDPDHDTPEVLADYAKRFHADGPRWFFVTGAKQELFTLARESFLVPVEIPEDKSEEIIHSDRFLVLDATGSLRAAHSRSHEEDIAGKVVHSIRILQSEAAAEAGARAAPAASE